MAAELVIWINGRICDIDRASIPASDRGLLYGDGLFETMRSYAGHVFRLDAHVQRLAESAAFLQIPLPYSTDELCRTIDDLVGRDDRYIRMTLTRGPHTRTLSLQTGQQATVMIHIRELRDYPSEYHDSGMPVCIASIRRNEGSPIVRHKTLNYLDSLLARAEATERDCAEAIMLNNAGDIAEGATSNVFWSCERTVFTPSPGAGLLPGITRTVVIEMCDALGIQVKEDCFRPEALQAADEIFLTNSLMELMPVRSVDGYSPRVPAPGPITKLLLGGYRDEISRERRA